MPGRLLSRVAGQLLLVPIVALGSYYVMAVLPPPVLEQGKTADVVRAAEQRYRDDLGLSSPVGFLRPWQKLVRGERLGASDQGVTGATIFEKLAGSVVIGLGGLLLAILSALLYAFVLVRTKGSRLWAGWQLLQAVAFATPVFIPGMLVASRIVSEDAWVGAVAAAGLLAVGPALFLGSLLEEGVERELASMYVRCARAKGLSRSRATVRHALPNVVPDLLDAIRPAATALLAGSFAAEKVFGLHHFGELYVNAVIHKQTSVVVVSTTLFAAIVVLVALVTETVRLLVDPRARDASGA